MTPRHLLLVDDDGLILATMSRELSEAGYGVRVADNGEEALIQTEIGPRPNLAILDIHMPGMSGIELAARLRRLDIDSIFLTAYDDSSYVEQAIAGGALGYLVKPIDVGHAIPTIETALRRSEELRGLRQTAQRLDKALETGNLVNVVIGMLMERYRLHRDDAYELIRRKARSERRKVRQVAEEIMASWDQPNPLHPRR